MTTASDFIRATQKDYINRHGYSLAWNYDDTYSLIDRDSTNHILESVTLKECMRYVERKVKALPNYQLHIAPSGKELKDFPIVENCDSIHVLKFVTKSYLHTYRLAKWEFHKWENLSRITRKILHILRIG